MENKKGFIFLGKHRYKDGFLKAMKKAHVQAFLAGLFVIVAIYFIDPQAFKNVLGLKPETESSVTQQIDAQTEQEKTEQAKELINSKNYGNEVPPMEF